MTQHPACRIDASLRTNLATELFPQLMQWFCCRHASRTQPYSQSIEIGLCAIVSVGCWAARFRVCLNHKGTGGFSVPTSEHRQKFLINRHVARSVRTFRREMFRFFNANDALIPPERRPLEFVDLIASQSCHSRQQEDFQLLWR